MNMRHAQAFHTNAHTHTLLRILTALLLRRSHFVFGLPLSLVSLLSCDAFRITERVRCICFTFYYATLKRQTGKTATQNSKEKAATAKQQEKANK